MPDEEDELRYFYNVVEVQSLIVTVLVLLYFPWMTSMIQGIQLLDHGVSGE